MFASIASTYALLPQAFRGRFLALVALSALAGLIELAGVASVMPLVASMVDAEGMMQNRAVGPLLRALGLTQAPPIHWAGIATIGLVVAANLASATLSWWSTRFAAQLTVALAEAVALATFRRPFAYFLQEPPAKLAHQMCNEVPAAATSGILQLCLILVKSIQLMLILGLLLAIAPAVTLTVSLLTGGLYFLIYRLSSVRIARWGRLATDTAADAAHMAAEMYAIAREILLRRDSAYFVGRVSRAMTVFARADARSRFWPATPKYALESFVVVLVFALPIWRSFHGQDARAELPLLVTFAYAGTRMLPAVQQIYASLAILRFHHAAIDRLRGLIATPDPTTDRLPMAAMPGSLEFVSVGFRYPGREDAAIEDVRVRIDRGERIAIVGPSGGGKSTLVDLILGLLEPDTGQIVIDGAPLAQASLAWEPGAVGYVPQTPLLVTDTIARNIAIGSGHDNPDPARCRAAALRAGILAMIESLPAGFDAVIGRDIQALSGGERQRLAIARALYCEPSLLVLDEPASALDPPTTRRLFEMLCDPALGATVLVITHDISHLGLFDRLVFVEGGRIAATGTLDELTATCDRFVVFRGNVAASQRRVSHAS